MSDYDFKDEKKEAKKEEIVKEDENEGLPEGLGVSSALGAFFKQDKFCDVTFVLRDEKDSKSGEAAKIGAHKIILAARSPVFEAMLFPAFEAQKKEDLKEIEIKGVKKGAFQSFLQAVYSGETEITPENISELSRLGKKYQVECVRRSCVDFLKTGVTIDNACLWFSRSAPSSSERTTSQRFIEDNFRKVMETDGFMELTSADLSILAKSGYLECDEVDLWNSILKWVDGQVDKRIVTDSVDDRKRALREVIPYIRFPIMKMDQLISKVTPTKLLPTDHILALYNYVGSKDTSDKAKFELHYPTQERNPRKPSSYFIWDGQQAASTSTFTYSATVPLTVSDNGLVLSSTGSAWNTAHGLIEWAPKTGVYQFEVILESYDATNTYNVVIGLIPATGDTRLKAGGPIAYGAQAGWGFITGQGQTTTGSGSYAVSSIGGINYTGQCRQGDRVGILYNSESGVVEFFKNGTALTGQTQRCTGSVRPAVSCVMTQRLRLNFKCKLVSSRS